MSRVFNTPCLAEMWLCFLTVTKDTKEPPALFISEKPGVEKKKTQPQATVDNSFRETKTSQEEVGVLEPIRLAYYITT